MLTPDGEILGVESNTLEDYAKGQGLFKDFTESVNKLGGATYVEFVKMGVVEGGAQTTKSGETGIAFLLCHGNNEGKIQKFYVGEITFEMFERLYTFAKQKHDEFLKPATGQHQ